MTDTGKLQVLLHNLRVCEERVLKELERVYPIGCEVEYRLREGVPTKFGTVKKHIGGPDGAVRVLLAPNLRAAYDRHTRYETTLPARKILKRVS